MLAMACPRERAAMVTVINFTALLFLLACQVGVISGDDPPSSSMTLKHQSVHVSKMLINTTSTGNDSGAAAAKYVAERRTTAPEDCSEEVVEVSQHTARPLPNGVPSYSVIIINTCLGCTVRDVHISCGEFASTVLVDPTDFRRITYGDCLVRDGGPMRPGDTVSFEYSNSFSYTMNVAYVSCG